MTDKTHPSHESLSHLPPQAYFDEQEALAKLLPIAEELVALVQEARAPQCLHQIQEPVVLPDGSAFAVASLPLPEDHWLYAPREYDHGAEEPKELPRPILTHAQHDSVVAAVRYAVRGATMCGKESDFDPDALVLNAVYALCGPFNSVAPAPQAAPAAVAVPDAVRDAEKLLRAEAARLDRLYGMNKWYGFCAEKASHLEHLRVADALAATPAEATESVLIDGVAYTIPEPVAHELLRLHIELQQAPVPVVLPEPDALISEVMGLVDEWGMESHLRGEAELDAHHSEATQEEIDCAKDRASKERAAWKAIESKLRALLATSTRLVLDYPWRDRLLDGRELVRDRQGFAEHPELPLLDEGMKPRAFFAALGVEMKHTMADDDLSMDEYDAMNDAENWSAWTPRPPIGEAWNLVAIFDTEDGPAAWWARAQETMAPAAQDAREFWGVIAPCGEGVFFKNEADARWTQTGDGSGSDGFGVPTIGEAFRESYEDDALDLVRVHIVAGPTAKGE